MTDGWNVFEQAVKNNLITYDNIRHIVNDQGNDYTNGCLLDYNYVNYYYKMIAKYLSKQQTLDTDPKAIQQINFTANLDLEGNITMFFIIQEAKKNYFRFFTRNL